MGDHVEGSDHVKVARAIELKDLGILCADLRTMHGREDYQRDFGWVDRLHVVPEGSLRAELERALLQQIRFDPGSLVLAPPEILEWDRVDHFRLIAGRGPGLEADLAGACRALRSTCSSLRRRASWSGWTSRCLSATAWSRWTKEYRRRLDQELDLIGKASIHLPPYQSGWEEREYNEAAARGLGMLLVDRRTVDSQNRQVELCDLLGEGANPFVHVKLLKKGMSSSVLSHLFGQGSVAGSLLKEDAEFRRKALARVRQAEEEQAQEPSCAAAAAAGGFSGPLADGYSSDGREVVYAIIAPWGGLDLVQKLPFFSKQNLCEHARRLRTAGYTVTHARIEAKAVATSAK